MRLLFLTPLFVACIPVLETPGGVDTSPWAAPTNTWPQGTPPTGLEGEGYDPGEVVPEFRVPDQFGDTVSLWQFYGSLVVVDISTMWCKPCQNLAADVQATADDYRADGLVYLTLLSQDFGSDVPDNAELNVWADEFGIAEPIVADQEAWSDRALPGQDYPGVFLVDRDMKMIGRVQPVDDEKLREAIVEHL